MKQTNDATDDSTHAGQRRTRRAFLGTTATVGAVTFAGCSGSTDDGAGSTADTTTGMGTTTTADMETTEEEGEMANPDVPILNYDTIRHHLDVLADNDVVKSSGNDYGAVYLPTDRARHHWGTVEDIITQLD